MRKGAELTLLAISILGIAYFHSRMKAVPTAKDVQQFAGVFQRASQWNGRVAPDFTLSLARGETFALADHIGKKVIVLNFFATWCGPCQEEMPELNKYYVENREQGFLLLGIDADEKPDLVSGFIAEQGLQFPVGIDHGKSIMAQYNVGSFPTTVLIGVDGRVHLYEVGMIQNAEVAFAPALAANRMLMERGAGITPEAYKALLRSDTNVRGRRPRVEEDPLEGRAKSIAEGMYCPCGCGDDFVSTCTCRTAKNIRVRLRSMPMEDRTDTEIITALNKEFCGGPH